MSDFSHEIAYVKELEAAVAIAGKREVAAFEERDQYMNSNVRLVAYVRRLRAAITDAVEALERGSTSAPVLESLKAALSATDRQGDR